MLNEKQLQHWEECAKYWHAEEVVAEVRHLQELVVAQKDVIDVMDRRIDEMRTQTQCPSSFCHKGFAAIMQLMTEQAFQIIKALSEGADKGKWFENSNKIIKEAYDRIEKEANND